MKIKMLTATLFLSLLLAGMGRGEAAEKLEPLPPVPSTYANKHMPDGWWTDSKIIEEGRAIYQGEKYGTNAGKGKEVNCSKCHGPEGKSIVKKNPDLSDPKVVNRMSDSFMFWRVSEGVPRTKMAFFKGRLTEEEIWKVMAYFHTFSHGGKAEVHDHLELK